MEQREQKGALPCFASHARQGRGHGQARRRCGSRPTAAAGQRRGLAGPRSGRASGARAPAGRRRGERAGGPRRRQGQGRRRLAAARGGRAVPAMAKQGASGRGRRNDEGCSATSGRSAAMSRPTQGWRAACAGGATGLPRRRSGSGGAGFERGKGRKGRGARGEAHRRLDLSGGRSGRGARWEGRSSTKLQWRPRSAVSIPAGGGLNRA